MGKVIEMPKIRRYCVTSIMPDGKNFFQGVHEVIIPTSQGKMPVKTNLWTNVFYDIHENAGIFTHKEARFYLSIIGMDGCKIENYERLKKVYDAKQTEIAGNNN